MFSLGLLSRLLSAVDSVLATINACARGARGWGRKLQLELLGNIELICSCVRYDLLVDDVITNLQAGHTKAAVESGSNFNAVKRARVAGRAAGDQPQYQRYVGWSTERLFSSIYVKIRDLQTIVIWILITRRSATVSGWSTYSTLCFSS